ncbi:MAG TPA: hypothetical protein VF723_08275 [Pyrinomonadaceae bacterium]|jgi:hypothetical protein
MGELAEKLWAVLSERGCEASGLTYQEAAEKLRGLGQEKLPGLCIVTERAARRVRHNLDSPAHPSGPAPARPIKA